MNSTNEIVTFDVNQGLQTLLGLNTTNGFS